MPKKNNQRVGSLGETIAIQYLSSIGYRIIERNFKKRYGEIDIVALEGNTLVFIEVKTRRCDRFGSPEEAISLHKRNQLIKSAQYYKMLHSNLPDSMRIDAVSVVLSSNNQISQINLYKNITS